MCDFHSVIVDGAGRIYHLPSNSHSAIAAHFNLNNEALESPHWECEWDGIGAQPINLCQLRGKVTAEPTSMAVRAVDRHYAKLASFLKGDRDADPLFLTADYSDVPGRLEWAKREDERRAKIEKLEAELAAERATAELLGRAMFATFGEQLEALPDAAMIIAIRQFVEESSVTMEETAEEEIESATNDMIPTDSAYDYVLGDGGYIACDDMDDYVKNSDDYFTQDQLDDAIEEAKTEWKREAVEALENVG